MRASIRALCRCAAVASVSSWRAQGITSDSYAVVQLGSAAVAHTNVAYNNTSPKWDQHYQIPVAHRCSNVVIAVKDSDVIGAQLMGTVVVPSEDVARGEPVEGWFPVLNAKGVQVGRNAKVWLALRYIPAEREPQGIGPSFTGVEQAYFPMRAGNRVTLYQDSHAAADFRPDIRMEGGVLREPPRLWEDMCT
eukprot:SM000041S15539  [mRNA]  locus=s41:629295:630602:- [translate_table: standard]